MVNNSTWCANRSDFSLCRSFGLASGSSVESRLHQTSEVVGQTGSLVVFSSVPFPAETRYSDSVKNYTRKHVFE